MGERVRKIEVYRVKFGFSEADSYSSDLSPLEKRKVQGN